MRSIDSPAADNKASTGNEETSNICKFRKSVKIHPPNVAYTLTHAKGQTGALDRLRLRAADVEFHMLDGGHRFPSQARLIADAWTARAMGPMGTT